MAGPRKKKYSSGEGAQYWSRATALRKLQLSLKDFRRLCILKGIYPREPRNRKKAQKGATGIRTLYNKKDIQFLMHEPVIWKFRDMKVHGRKIGRAKAMKEGSLAKKLINNQIQLNLDHIVKERYPTFNDALKDLDDCLTLCFLFSTFPSLKHVPRDQSALCRRLTLEFLHAVIASKALRKVFISIKGYYFQAEIKGNLITWILPHQFCFEPQTKEDVDFRIMSTFVQFYIVLLGFVNFRLYHDLNLIYPPKFASYDANQDKSLVDAQAFASERVAALNVPISTVSVGEEEVALDDFSMESTDPNTQQEAMVEAEKVRKLKTLFKGFKVFLNREVPREPLVFMLRSFGAEVSWDKVLFVGSTFPESDETITHHIVDRPSIDKQYISRYYVQPQWVFDSVNARQLQPVEKYFLGCVLPPHLSPFVDSSRTQYYIPQEAPDAPLEIIQGKKKAQEVDKTDKEEEEESEEEEVDEEEEEEEEDEDSDESDSSEENEVDEVENEKRLAMKKAMKVTRGKANVVDPDQKYKDEKQEYKLREKMVAKKHRGLYRSMMKGRAQRMRDVRYLKYKRHLVEEKKAADT